ncbi:hypothetical protein Bbelb_130380 [Branchiostoma belcheri]|nr:hypothetical protein Bbelb_130380 [Branchiostoma belcheri]
MTRKDAIIHPCGNTLRRYSREIPHHMISPREHHVNMTHMKRAYPCPLVCPGAQRRATVSIEPRASWSRAQRSNRCTTDATPVSIKHDLRDGGRYRLQTTFDPLMTSHVGKITCPQHLGQIAEED